jgi:L,D-transpeptidase ErfK/SrfK
MSCRIGRFFCSDAGLNLQDAHGEQIRHNDRMRITTLSLASLLATALLISGCQLQKPQVEAAVKVAPVPPSPTAPIATHQFVVADDDDVIGLIQVTHTGAEDTLSDVARRFNLGFDEIVRANPGVDPWLPGEGREIVLPTQFVIPNAPRDGLIVNLPELRVFYFPPRKEGEPQTVITHPIGIGKVGWSTPEGTTKIISKRKNPVWTPPLSVRKEHKENGDPLPKQVPPGPDNPLGAYSMTLGWPSYLIHGTNKPYGVGMRSSHGCMRFYPEDITLLFEQIPIGTPVHVVNQPVLMGWHQDAIYLQALPVMEDDTNTSTSAGNVLNTAISDDIWQKAKEHRVAVDLQSVDNLLKHPRGVAVPISKQGVTLDSYLLDARRVLNRIPAGATWDGREELLVTAEEYEAVRTGKPLPKKKQKS